MKTLEEIRIENNGVYPWILFPSAIGYLDKDNSLVCAKCAEDNKEYFPITSYFLITDSEEEIELCDECSKPIDIALREDKKEIIEGNDNL